MNKLTLKTEGDRDIVVSRHFAASFKGGYWGRTAGQCRFVFTTRNHGGKIRYEWANHKGAGFHLTGAAGKPAVRLAAKEPKNCARHAYCQASSANDNNPKKKPVPLLVQS